MSKVLQVGLYETSEEKLNDFADRVSNYNKGRGFIAVAMEGTESNADELYDGPHWKIQLEFASRADANAFWTDPAYQKRILT